MCPSRRICTVLVVFHITYPFWLVKLDLTHVTKATILYRIEYRIILISFRDRDLVRRVLGFFFFFFLTKQNSLTTFIWYYKFSIYTYIWVCGCVVGVWCFWNGKGPVRICLLSYFSLRGKFKKNLMRFKIIFNSFLNFVERE